MSLLNIPGNEKSQHDFLALGALVTRLDPGVVPFAQASQYDLHVSGGEYNVAANLSLCFGLRTAIASAIVDYPIGKRIEASGEERRAGHEEPSRRGNGRRSPVGACPANDEQGERVVELVAHARLEDRQHVRVHLALQRVGPEGPQRHPQKPEPRSDQNEHPVHSRHPIT